MGTGQDSSIPAPSAVSNLIFKAGAKSESEALPLEVLQNLQYQHGWSDLRLHRISDRNSHPVVFSLDSSNFPTSTPRSQTEDVIHLISGLPPRHSYLHPDFQAHLLKYKIEEQAVEVQREWVLPVSLGEKWSLKKFCRAFEALPAREYMVLENGSPLGMEWRDSKRVLMGMEATSGMGGDGTVVYYVMQEGEVKPRQNG